MDYLIARDLQEAIRMRRDTGFALLAGGTDLYPALENGRAIAGIIDLSRVDALKGGIRLEGDRCVIPALTTWDDLRRAELPALFDALKQAAADVGGQQIQNTGTIGGNICNASPAADGSAVLCALDAQVVIAGGSGQRSLPFAAFVTGNRRTALGADELVEAIHVPLCGGRHASAFVKLGARRYLVISIVMVCVVLEIDDQDRIAHARIAVGACSDRPLRLDALEQRLRGVALERVRAPGVTSSEDLSALAPLDDIRGSATYRRAAAAALVDDGLAAAARRLMT